MTTIDEESWLREFVTAHGGVAGSVHVRQGDALVLKNAFNLPPPVVEATQTIPKGKGMAGLAWARERPVTTCNLKTDETGDVRPGAKAVDAQGAVALPVRDAQGEIRAVVGIAFARERDFTDEQLSDLANAALRLR